ncbi:HD domain-containing protein [Enterococcus songbeiensis]|uniref:HD domain-containing protein n=1 Tax=Enterococcus songbeiensis TaxID=2559927 RepID=UPI0010F75405|nr:HD domain-containing protein [Enterococcus songbeiensis]
MDKQIEKITEFAKMRLGQDHTGHGFDHAQRVARLARKITEEQSGDPLIIQGAALLHDTIDDKVVADSAKALQEVEAFLHSLTLTQEQVTEILYIITHLSFSRELEKGKAVLSIEGQIVQDADRLDALGALGIMRTAYFGGSHGHPIYDPEIKPENYQDKATYRKGSTVINHFYEKLFLLADSMNTRLGKEEAMRRKKFMTDFLAEFYQEWAD